MGKTKAKNKGKKPAESTNLEKDVTPQADVTPVTLESQSAAENTGGNLLGAHTHRAWAALLRSHAFWVERIERRVRAQDGLSLEAYDVLLMLSYAPQGRLRMGALYEAVTLSRSGLTRLVDRLEKEGFVQREVCPQDRRSFEAILTPAGEAARAQSWPLYARAIAEEFGQFFDETEARALAELLEKPLKMDGDQVCNRG